MELLAITLHTVAFVAWYIIVAARSETSGPVLRAFAVSFVGMSTANLLIMGFDPSGIAVIAASACPLIGATLAMWLASRLAITSFWWGVIAFAGAIAGVGAMFPVGLLLSCMDCM